MINRKIVLISLYFLVYFLVTCSLILRLRYATRTLFLLYFNFKATTYIAFKHLSLKTDESFILCSSCWANNSIFIELYSLTRPTIPYMYNGVPPWTRRVLSPYIHCVVMPVCSLPGLR